VKIYVASSWKNVRQPGIVDILRQCGHEVYDFRHPSPGDSGFSWKEVMPNHGKRVSPVQYREALQHPIAQAGYAKDINALRSCDAVVFVLPCGRSASWEFGYAMGQGKPGYVVMFEDEEPDLMFSEARILTNIGELLDIFYIKVDER
jgi:nucleoside 2-deoxyribosyltransferase